MSLKAFVDSKWLRGLFRSAVVVWTLVIAPAVGYVAWTVRDVWARQAANAAEIVEIQSTLATRAADNERFQMEVRAGFVAAQATTEAVDEHVGQVAEQVEDIAIDAAMTRGILEELRRRDVAGWNLPAGDGSVVALGRP